MNTNWRLILGVVVFLIPASSGTQEVEHAPTVAQCQADRALWDRQAFDAVKAGATPFANLSFVVLREMEHEMSNCQVTDPSNRNDYSETQGTIEVYMSLRAADFIKRHNLWDQFIAEDAAGQR